MELKYYPKLNTIYCGDNSKVLKYFPNRCIDLIYIDPPFFSGRNYDLVFGDKYAIRAYTDTFKEEKESYYPFMKKRIFELHRVLKSTGSFYLHCDYHASHYLKIICDKIFGKNNFRNEIIWWYSNRWTNISKSLQRNHDTILFYTKSNNYTFNIQYLPLTQSSINRYDKTDEDGRKYANLLHKGKRYKKYLDESKGRALGTVWDIKMLGSKSKERMGYPTQKPEALLERIIKISSNEGDIVADFFCGCGTTLAVAKRLNRKWIGIDVSPVGCVIMAKRIKYKRQNIQGMKYTLEQAKDIHWLEYQIWTIIGIGGVPNTKKGADTGIDGWHNNNIFKEPIPIEVKQGNISRPHVQKFNTVIEREKRKGGVMIGFHITKPAKIEAKRIKEESGVKIIFVEHDEVYSFDELLLTKKGLTDLSCIMPLI